VDNFPTEHAFNFLKWLFSPTTISMLSVYGTTIGFVGRWAWKKLEAKQNEDLANMKSDIKDLSDNVNDSMLMIQRDMLRLQIITGINSGRLSAGEVTLLYDQYKDKGGNSYISRIVDDYLEETLDAKHSK
jgi:hypothetical protein